MIPYKTQLEDLKKELNDIEGFKGSKYYELAEMKIITKISLLSQIIDDLKKEWQNWDKFRKEAKRAKLPEDEEWAIAKLQVLDQITGMSNEEKE